MMNVQKNPQFNQFSRMKIRQENLKNNTMMSFVIGVVITLIIACIGFYFFLPAINFKSIQFWAFLLGVGAVYLIVQALVFSVRKEKENLKWIALVECILFVCMVLGSITSMRFFHAKEYSSILKVDDGSTEDIPSVSGTSSIALMDTASAEKLGDRKIGSLSDVVSQFNVGEYMQIDYQNSPIKVAPLQYDGFFKWFGNHENGIPGYVKVNPVTMDAEYVSMTSKMKYVPSAYFNENLERHIRFTYPTTMFTNLHFEIDEEGNPWYIASTYTNSISLFGGKKITGAILVNPIDGTMTKLDVKDVPRWADIIYPGNLIVDQYNDSAKLHRGFLNSIFGQIDCRQTTTVEIKNEDGDKSYRTDYGYIAKDGDIWIYTGVTSVNGDSSNIGFIMANERTSETKFILASGADEGSGMHSAEGEVQEKGYHASFPSLINVDGTPTYIMVLKDDNGLVKMYACVNVEQYNMVVTAYNQKDAIEQYRRLLKGEISTEQANQEVNDAVDTSNYKEKEITVAKLEKIDISGNTYLYIIDTDQNIYKAKYADVIKMITVNVGDKITIKTDGTYYLYE